MEALSKPGAAIFQRLLEVDRKGALRVLAHSGCELSSSIRMAIRIELPTVTVGEAATNSAEPGMTLDI